MQTLRDMSRCELRELYMDYQRRIEATTDPQERARLREAQARVYEEWHYKRFIRNRSD